MWHIIASRSASTHGPVMAASPEFCEHLTDLLRPFGPVGIRRMFGGAGLFRDGLMFALIADDTLYFKADAESRPIFEDAGCPPFTYESRGGEAVMSYYQAPPEAMEGGELLCGWAVRAFEAALRAQKRNRKPFSSKPGRPRRHRRPRG